MKAPSSIAKYSRLLIIVVAAFVIHGSVLGRFWLGDDPQVLLHALRYDPLEVVSEKDAWQELSTSNFTPMVTWSFDLDLSLFGLDPAPFYAHQVLSVALAALALRLLMLALGVGTRESLAVAFVFLAAPPTIHVAGMLMTRHYVEGLIAAALSVALWVMALARTERRFLVVSSVITYGVAILAKEVFVLLPLIHIALASGRETIRRIAVAMIPFGALTAMYLLWRGWILESAGGYGGESPLVHLFGVTVDWTKAQPLTAMWLGMLIVIGAVSWLRTKRDVLRFSLVAVATLAPLAAIGDSLEGRHLLFPATAALCAALGGIDARVRDRWRPVLLLTVAVLTAVAGVTAMFREPRLIARMEAEGRYVWDEPDAAPPLLAGSPGWYLDGLSDLDRIWRRETSPYIVFSELGLYTLEKTDRYVMFDSDGVSRVAYLEDIPKRVAGYVAGAPIELEIRRERHELSWRFGPSCDCTWRFYSYPDYQAFVIPPAGSRVVPRPREQQWFRIERRESAGSWTLSPPLRLPRNGETIRWKRDE